MRRCGLVLAVWCLASMCQAQELIQAGPKTLLDVSAMSSGTYLLTVEGSQITIVKANVITPDSPQPPDPPQPDELTERAKEIKQAAEAVGDEKTAVNLGATFRELSKQCGTKLKGYEQIGPAVSWIWDKVADDQATAWAPVKTIVGDELAKIAQEGGTDADYAKYLNEAADGLEAAAPNGPYQIDLELILKLLEIFIEYILPLIINNPGFAVGV